MSLTITEARDDILKMAYDAWVAAGYTANNLIYDDKDGSIPTNGERWARITVRHETGSQASLSGGLGTQKYLRTGTVFVQIFEPSGEGLSSIDNSAKIIMDAFEGKSSPNGVWFRNVTFQEIGPDGNFFNGNVTIGFEYNELK